MSRRESRDAVRRRGGGGNDARKPSRSVVRVRSALPGDGDQTRAVGPPVRSRDTSARGPIGPRSAFPATPPVPPAAAASGPAERVAESEDARRVARRVPFDAHAPVDWTFARRQSSAARAAAVEAAAAAAAEAELRRFARALLPDEAFAHHLADDFDVDSPPNLSPPRPPEVCFDIAGTRAAAGRTTASSLFIDEAAPSPGTPSEQPGGGVDPRRRARHAAAAGSGHIAATPPLPNAHEHKHPRVSSAGAEGCTRGGMGSPTGLRLLRRGTFARASDSPDARVSPSSIFTAAKLSGGANANTNGNTNANGDANPTTPHARRDDP